MIGHIQVGLIQSVALVVWVKLCKDLPSRASGLRVLGLPAAFIIGCGTNPIVSLLMLRVHVPACTHAWMP